MLVLKATNLRKEWQGKVLFDQVSFDIPEGKKIAVYGRNGIGKTTLLKGLLGQISFDAGVVERRLPLDEWGWIEQAVPKAEAAVSVYEFIMSGTRQLYRLKQELERSQQRLGTNASANELETYGRLYEAYEQADGFQWELQVEMMMRRFGFDPGERGSLPYASLSGGQKTKAQLARLMVSEPKFVLLDEPTNHLDEETMDELERWMRAFPGTILFVSHDRYFLDQTADAICELQPDGCQTYTGGYTAWRRQKERERRTLEIRYNKEQQEKRKLEEAIRRYQQWFHQAHKAAGQNDFLRSRANRNASRLKAKESALQQLDSNAVRRPGRERQLHMRLTDAGFQASVMVRMEQVQFAYERKPLFRDVNLTIRRGDRIAVIGPNGSGKSTLLKLITGRLVPSQGSITSNPQTKIGYFAQEPGEWNKDETILDHFLSLPDMTESEARTILGCFLFSGDAVMQKTGDLSMGEKCRIAFLSLYFGQSNLLVLDEPTNYLDVETREKTEEALADYPGAMVLVSHDRYFVRKLANRLWFVEPDGSVKDFQGTYEEYEAVGSRMERSPEEQLRVNERQRKELKLAQLIAAEEPEDEAERAALVDEIRRLKQELE